MRIPMTRGPQDKTTWCLQYNGMQEEINSFCYEYFETVFLEDEKVTRSNVEDERILLCL